MSDSQPAMSVSQKHVHNRDTPHSSDVVERVATELETVWLYGQREGIDLWRALAAKSLEASHHAELVFELRLARGYIAADSWKSRSRVLRLDSIDALLAKIGGAV